MDESLMVGLVSNIKEKDVFPVYEKLRNMHMHKFYSQDISSFFFPPRSQFCR